MGSGFDREGYKTQDSLQTTVYRLVSPREIKTVTRSYRLHLFDGGRELYFRHPGATALQWKLVCAYNATVHKPGTLNTTLPPPSSYYYETAKRQPGRRTRVR